MPFPHFPQKDAKSCDPKRGKAYTALFLQPTLFY